MTISRKFVAIGLGATVLLSGVGIASANNLIFDVTAQLNYEMQMMNNGQEYNPINENNEAIRPLVYEGQVYLPESIIEDAAKLNVDYDETTKKLWVGEKSDRIYLNSDQLRPKSQDNSMVVNGLYYTENSKELFVNNRMFKSALKAEPNRSSYLDFYFNTREISGKASVIGGAMYVDKSVPLDKVTVKFRKSRDEGEEILEYFNLIPGEILDFELDTNGANIVVMEIEAEWSDYTQLTNLSFFDLYYK